MATERFLSVFMDQNNKCNLRCVMCGFSDPRVPGLGKYDMPLALFEKVVAEVLPATSYLALSCLTEPYMTRDFDLRLELASRSGVPFTEVITNGTLWNEERVEKLVACRISRVAVSIDGATAATYERIRVGARFDRVLSNVRMLTERKRRAGSPFPALRINHVLSEANVEEFPAFLAMAEELGADGVDVRTVARMSDAVYKGTADAAFYGKVLWVRDELRAFTERTGIADWGVLRWQPSPIDLFAADGGKVTCRRPWDTVAIHANGDVSPCISWTRPPVGNLARSSFGEIWGGPALAALREEFTASRPGIDCEHCVVKKSSTPEEDDDFFYRMLAKPAPESSSREGRDGSAASDAPA